MRDMERQSRSMSSSSIAHLSTSHSQVHLYSTCTKCIYSRLRISLSYILLIFLSRSLYHGGSSGSSAVKQVTMKSCSCHEHDHVNNHRHQSDCNSHRNKQKQLNFYCWQKATSPSSSSFTFRNSYSTEETINSYRSTSGHHHCHPDPAVAVSLSGQPSSSPHLHIQQIKPFYSTQRNKSNLSYSMYLRSTLNK